MDYKSGGVSVGDMPGMVNFSLDRRSNPKKHNTGFLCENRTDLFYGLFPGEARMLAEMLIEAADEAERTAPPEEPKKENCNPFGGTP